MRTRNWEWNTVVRAGVLVVALAACTDERPLEPSMKKAEAPTIRVGVGSDIVVLREGESLTVFPENEAPGDLRHIWSSGDADIASVSRNGTITGVATGTTMVNVQARGMSTDLLVTVLPRQDQEGARVTYQ